MQLFVLRSRRSIQHFNLSFCDYCLNIPVSPGNNQNDLALTAFTYIERHQLQKFPSAQSAALSHSPSHFLEISSHLNAKNFQHNQPLSLSPFRFLLTIFPRTYSTNKSQESLGFYPLQWGQVISIDKMYVGSALTHTHKRVFFFSFGVFFFFLPFLSLFFFGF